MAQIREAKVDEKTMSTGPISQALGGRQLVERELSVSSGDPEAAAEGFWSTRLSRARFRFAHVTMLCLDCLACRQMQPGVAMLIPCFPSNSSSSASAPTARQPSSTPPSHRRHPRRGANHRSARRSNPLADREAGFVANPDSIQRPGEGCPIREASVAIQHWWGVGSSTVHKCRRVPHHSHSQPRRQAA